MRINAILTDTISSTAVRGLQITGDLFCPSTQWPNYSLAGVSLLSYFIGRTHSMWLSFISEGGCWRFLAFSKALLRLWQWQIDEKLQPSAPSFLNLKMTTISLSSGLISWSAWPVINAYTMAWFHFCTYIWICHLLGFQGSALIIMSGFNCSWLLNGGRETEWRVTLRKSQTLFEDTNWALFRH